MPTFVNTLKINSKEVSHKEHEEHKEKSRIFIRYLIVKLTLSLHTTTPNFLCVLCNFVLFVINLNEQILILEFN